MACLPPTTRTSAALLSLIRRTGVKVAGKKAVILGSGGTSLTARAACESLGARKTVTVSRKGPVDYEALYRDHADAEVLINATPVGMYPGNGVSPADVARLPALEGVIDVIYNPDRTPLVLAAQKRGLPAAGGLWMLVMQAVLAAEKFLGKPVDTERAADIYAALRAERLNIVLTGMPGSGKTTLGRALAEALHRPFVDCDAEIERAAGMPIPEIFRTQGEAAFRALESEIIARFGKESGQVVATGGGAPLREENAVALRQNGVVLRILRPVELLATAGRPLSAGGLEALRRMEAERAPLLRSLRRRAGGQLGSRRTGRGQRPARVSGADARLTNFRAWTARAASLPARAAAPATNMTHITRKTAVCAPQTAVILPILQVRLSKRAN